MKIIRGKKALVTGAAFGIGRAIALALAREGADLYLVDIDEANLRTAAREAEQCGVKAAIFPCDLSQPAAITATVNAVLAQAGGIHILVNNAGIAYYGRTDAMTAEQWNRLLAVNLLAPIQLVGELLPTLAAQDEAHILNVCSFLGLAPARKMTAYQTSKFGLVGLTAALHAEYARSSFGVTALCPGFVNTTLTGGYATVLPNQARHHVPEWLGTRPDRVAASAIRAIRRNKGMVVLTPFARLWWWVARLSPALAGWIAREGWRRKGRIEIAPR
jgi:3-oxoacyl-[acyl-carrier protein] reductase